MKKFGKMYHGICNSFNDVATEICTRIEKDFLRELMGGCSTPISALAQTDGKEVYAIGSVFSVDGKQTVGVQKMCSLHHAHTLGKLMEQEILRNGGRAIMEKLWANKAAAE